MKQKECACGCGEPIEYPKMGKQFIDKKHYIHWLETSESGQKSLVKAQRKAIEKIKRDKSVKKKELKESIKTISEWKSDLQVLVNHIARLIDYGQPCIATGNHTGKMNGGHFHSVGSNSTLRYNLHNIHIQSEHSNSFKGGDSIKYMQGLKKNYGLKYFDFVIELCAIQPLKLSILEIREGIKKARKIVLELKEKNEFYSAEKRIELRNIYNTEIGFYKNEF